MRVLFIYLFIFISFSSSLFADETIKAKPQEESVNYCHTKEKIEEWEGLIIQYPQDPYIIKLYSLRIGLCKAVDDKKIPLDTAIDIFNAEHHKIIEQRFGEDVIKNKYRKKEI